jgi:hypothetical protein
MSEAFFERFTEMLFGAIITVLLFTSSVMVLLAYAYTQNMVFYYCYLGVLGFSFFYAFRYAQSFKHFKETLNLYIPSQDSNPGLEPLNMEAEDLPLKVCLYYRNGATYKKIQQDLGIAYPQQVKRELIKGLDILLREYNCKKVEP